MTGFCLSDLPLCVSIDSGIDRSFEDNIDRFFIFTVVAFSLLNLRRRSQKLSCGNAVVHDCDYIVNVEHLIKIV